MKRINILNTFVPVLFLLANCSSQSPAKYFSESAQPSATLPPIKTLSTNPIIVDGPPVNQTLFADVLSVQVTGDSGGYQFSVEISSPDTGCEQFADWWEVVSAEGELLSRRILLHSHVDEQPFTRSGGPVELHPDAVVFIRAHMNTTGYGGQVLRGTVQNGFEPFELGSGFGSELEGNPPLPENCAF